MPRTLGQREKWRPKAKPGARRRVRAFANNGGYSTGRPKCIPCRSPFDFPDLVGKIEPIEGILVGDEPLIVINDG
jgi:hypothetical protein